MARLFITPREIDFISDIAKEITKDVIGQKIYYYRVREDISDAHDVYEEAQNKVFDPPVEIDCRVDWQQREITTDRFGQESKYNIQIYVHFRDMIDRDIRLDEGDYFSYGDNFFEITSLKYDSVLFGQVEHVNGYVLAGKQARRGLINEKIHGPTEEFYTDPDAEQENFVQQRGDAQNALGKTGDIRQLQKDGKIEKPITGPKTVKKSDGISSSFYGDE
jgi:hypothetical protein